MGMTLIPPMDESERSLYEREDQPIYRTMWKIARLVNRRYFYSEGEAFDFLKTLPGPVSFRLENVRTAEILALWGEESGAGPDRGS